MPGLLAPGYKMLLGMHYELMSQEEAHLMFLT